MNRRVSSLKFWFLFLLLLIILDIFTTTPAFEGNPFTIYMWTQIGILLSAWIKIGQILFFGVICLSAKRIAKPKEWIFARKILLGIILALVAFYIFVVSWNVVLTVFSRGL